MNPFREKLIPVPPNNYFERSGGKQILYKGEMQSPNYVRYKKGWMINSDGVAEFQKIHIGNQLITLAPGDSLQAAIDDLSLGDGGHIFLQSGTYTISSTVSLKSSVQIIGENTSTTIIDFNNTAGKISAAGTSAYTTGTIVNIANSVVLTGSGTAWQANLTTNHQIFLGNKWYKISAITSDTQIILAEGYTGGATLPSTYRAVIPVKDIEIKDLTFKNSTGTALDFDDVRNVFLEDLEIVDNNKGFTMDNVSEIAIDNVIVPSNTSNGCEFNNCGFGDMEGLATPANGGHGVVINNVRLMPFDHCASNSNTGDGYNITTGDSVQLIVEASGNGGQGIEFVSANVGCFVHNSIIETNTSDGIKLTATTDDTIISQCQINDNGGYGVNVAASTDDNTIITTNKFADNTSGAVNNSGTGTVIRGNVGVSDNSSSSNAFPYTTGTDLLLSADTERSSGSASYSKIKECSISGYASGVINVYFELNSSNNTQTAYGRVYINGIAVGTERSQTSSTYAAYNEDFTIVAGDLIQLYVKADNPTSAFIRNFRLRTTQGAETSVVVTD